MLGYRLPNGMDIHCLNRNDARAIYEEIFDEDVYRRHGITIRPGDCILDVGANIGLFSLFLQHLRIPATVYSVEPVPTTFERCATTLRCCAGLTMHLSNVGLAREDGEATFTHYPRLSCVSSMYPVYTAETNRRRRDDILQRFRVHPNRPLRRRCPCCRGRCGEFSRMGCASGSTAGTKKWCASCGRCRDCCANSGSSASIC